MDRTRRTILPECLRFLFLILVFPTLVASATLYFLTPLKSSVVAAALPATANIVLNLDANVAASFNSGTPSDGDAISSWTDQSTNALVFSHTSTNRPTYKTNIVNGKPAVLFDATQTQQLRDPGSVTLISTGTAFTSVLVARVTTYPGASQYRYGYNFKHTSTDSSPSFFYSINAGYLNASFGADTGSPVWKVFRMTSFTETNWHWNAIYYNGSGSSSISNYSATHNGSALTLTAATGNNGSTVNIVGCYTASTIHCMNGYIAQWIVWNKSLSAGEKTELATYMTSKYGL